MTAIAAGHYHSLFLKSDGSLWAMGGNQHGELGDRTLNDTNRTEQILVQTASPYTGAEPPDECFTGSKPNNAYGYGIVDAYEAVKQALARQTSH